jgi:hypothetical protein
MSDDDRDERERVYSRIAALILQFRDEDPSATFHVEDLRQYVLERVVEEIAPDSPGRILRLLREEGKLDYVVINRRQSLYQFRVAVPEPDYDHAEALENKQLAFDDLLREYE